MSSLPERDTGLDTKSTQSVTNQRHKLVSQVKKPGMPSKGISAKPRRITKPQEPDVAGGRKTKEIFRALCKAVDGGEVDFSNCFGVGAGEPALPFPLDTPGSFHAQYDPSYLEKRLLDKKNLLHFAVSQNLFEDTDTEYLEPKDYSCRYAERRCNFIIWLLQRYPGMLSECCSANKTPLCLFIEQSRCRVGTIGTRRDFLVEATQRVLGNDKIRCEFEKVLADPGKGYLIHLAIKYFGSEVIPFIPLVKESAISVQDNYGYTPLHIAVDIEKWVIGDPSQRVLLVQELIKKCDWEALTKKGGNPILREELRESPYLYMVSRANVFWSSFSQLELDRYPRRANLKGAFELMAFYLKDAYMSLEDHDVFEHLYRGQKSRFGWNLDTTEQR